MILIAGTLSGGELGSSSNGFGQETKLTAKEVAQKAGISEERAKDVIKILNYQLSKEGFTLAGSTGSLAVAERKSGFDPKAVNPRGGVAGYFQWSGWDNTINGNRWAQAPSKSLTPDVELTLMSTELNGNFKKVKEEMQKATDPKKASLFWSEHYEGAALSDSQTNAQKLQKDAQKWYDIFKDSLTSSGVIAFSGQTGLTTGALLSSFSFPKEYEGKLKYGKPKPETLSTLASNTYPVGQCTW